MGVSNQPPDVEHLEPMLERITASAGALPDMVTMDAGYSAEYGHALRQSQERVRACH